jgi:LmbE family N-acetylglucosaminyl deacetylase
MPPLSPPAGDDTLEGATSVAVVAAHPDDEVVGCGARLARLGARCTLIHVTDGAPYAPGFLLRSGLPSREAYARRRREELLEVAALAGIPAAHCLSLGVVDQEASRQLVPLTHGLRELLEEVRPTLILTHPYEGGHPDHDAAAFIVRAAARALQRQGGQAPEVFEFTSYHLHEGQLRAFEFLPGAGGPVRTLELSEPEQQLKLRMYGCYVTQQHVLRRFPVAVERYRQAPWYDFTRPPMPGQLFYETFSSGMKPEEWLALAAAAHEQLEREGIRWREEAR